MNVLVIARGQDASRVSPFVLDQIAALQILGVKISVLPIRNGRSGYVRGLFDLHELADSGEIDLIHAHYGMTASLAVLQNKLPVVATYHGSDIHSQPGRLASIPSLLRADEAIFVTEALRLNTPYRPNSAHVLPCGFDDTVFRPLSKEQARDKLGWPQDEQRILFASSFTRSVKNPELALAAAGHLGVRLVELSGQDRQGVLHHLAACDSLVMTSHREGSPVIIKEALAVGCPIVSVDVGDVRAVTAGAKGVFIADPEVASVARAIEQALTCSQSLPGESFFTTYSNRSIANRLLDIYSGVVQRSRTRT